MVEVKMQSGVTVRGDSIKKISEKEWREEGTKLFGEDMSNWRFKCCNCGHVQSVKDFKDLNIEEPENKAYFSCIGRWTHGCQGKMGNKIQPCNYTLGGLLCITDLFVVTEEGKDIPVFEFDRG